MYYNIMFILHDFIISRFSIILIINIGAVASTSEKKKSMPL